LGRACRPSGLYWDVDWSALGWQVGSPAEAIKVVAARRLLVAQGIGASGDVRGTQRLDDVQRLDQPIAATLDDREIPRFAPTLPTRRVRGEIASMALDADE
jgi:hypothetical protein